MATSANETNVPYQFDAPVTISGLTGTPFRFAGATGSGPPLAGLFAQNDAVFDQTGNWWVCATAGTPGSWVSFAANAVTATAPVSGRFLCPPVVYATATNLTVANATFAAIASGSLYTGTFTAPASGSVLVSVSLLAGASATASAVAWGLARTGTAGTVIGTAIVHRPQSAGITGPMSLLFPLGSLSGSYCLDLMWAAQASGTGSVTIGTVQTGTAPVMTAPAAPAVVTVEAV
jgi:hypothetical protein